MFIRHGEKPQPGGDAGVNANGTIDDESLTPRGWQRAGALARFFCRTPPDPSILPGTVFASGVAHDSKANGRSRP
jgi:broad specificity phosphatase PhoE